MKLKRNQRYTVYCILLAEIEELLKLPFDGRGNLRHRSGGLVGGICDLICYEFNTSSLSALDQLGLTDLRSMKPEQNADGSYWFSRDTKGWKIRIELIKECIRRTS